MKQVIQNSLYLRDEFINFFIEKNHKHIPGSSILPSNDNSIMFTNAGMNQFKDIFLGTTKSDYKRATTSQRCIRAGGKHNDLSNVGFTSRHLTCFEMLGNFSFGDYFKDLSIEYAWEFLTKKLKMNPDNLWITVFRDDDAAYDIWKNKIGINEKKIIRLDEKDNFWQMGDVGPCGPCSEIYVDTGIKNDIDKTALPGDDFSTRFLEIWNLVFIQYNKNLDGSLIELENKGIDTGMGLERLAMILQNKSSIFETDAFDCIIKLIEKQTNKDYASNIGAFRAIADHLRSSSCIIAEGIIPSNDARGYILRKIIRRALLFSDKLGNIQILQNIVENFIEAENSLYIDLKEHKNFIKNIIFEETSKFKHNLNTGTKKFFEMINLKSKKLSGDDAFILYDTYGFPVEITEILAKENNLEIDMLQYNKNMEEQKNRSKDVSNKNNNQKYDLQKLNIKINTEFIGYEILDCESIIKNIIFEGQSVDRINENNYCIIVLDKSVFYAGGGGQIRDSGEIIIDELSHDIINIHKINNMNYNAVGIEVYIKKNININDKIKLKVNENNRKVICAHHTSVHLLQAALRKIYGNYIKQEGSSVNSFEITYDASLSHLPNLDEMKKIEEEINNNIQKNINVKISYMTYDEAISKGALAFFSEKYDKSKVRTVFIDDISKELCGGTHVKNTGEIGLFILKNVITVSSGIKRFIGVANVSAYKECINYKDIVTYCIKTFKCQSVDIIEYINKNIESNLLLKKENNKTKEELIIKIIDEWMQRENNNYGLIILNNKFKDLDRYAMEILQKKRPGFYFIIIEDIINDFIFAEISNNQINKIFDLILIGEKLKSEYSFKGKITNKNIVGIIKKGANFSPF